MNLHLHDILEPARFAWLYSGQPHPDNSLNAPLLQDKGAVTLPTLGSLVPGWTLTFPAEPSLNLACTSRAQRRAVFEQANEAAQRLSKLGLRIFHFEHGPAVEGSVVGCGLDLAHLHTVALSFDLIAAATARDEGLSWNLQPIESAWDLEEEYLTVWETGASHVSVAEVETPVSQFFRKVIAHKLKMPTRWDYRDHAFRANIDATRQVFCE